MGLQNSEYFISFLIFEGGKLGKVWHQLFIKLLIVRPNREGDGCWVLNLMVHCFD